MKPAGPRFAVVASRFNARVVDRLLRSCLQTLRRKKVSPSSVRVVRVPGAFELPWAAQELALSGLYDAVIALGCVMKGETKQNDCLAAAVIRNLQAVGLKTRVPVALGVIAPDTEEQALARTRGRLDRGREAALAALEVVKLRGGLLA